VTIDEEYRERQLIAAIESIAHSYQVVQLGIIAEEEEIEIVSEYRDQLVLALANLQSKALISSISEYKNMKAELVKITNGLRLKRDSLKRMNKFLLEKEHDRSFAIRQLEDLRSASRKGTVLPFKAKLGN
jgi:hypothetical protein